MSKQTDKMALWEEVMKKHKENLEKYRQSETTLPTKDTLISPENSLQSLQKDIDNLTKDIQTEYTTIPANINTQSFDNLEEEIKKVVKGQNEAIDAFARALKRPYVMGYEQTRAKNVIVVTGPEGSGRHTLLKTSLRILKERKLTTSLNIAYIDLSRYSASSQETIFLQDLYQALQSDASYVLFENWEACFPAYLRMLSELVCEGRVVLNKRYVLSQGILVENQTGLVKKAIDALQVNAKYLIFLGENGLKSLQNAFGASFLERIYDVVELQTLNEETLKEIITVQLNLLQQKSQTQFQTQLTIDSKLNDYVYTNINKHKGTNAIEEMMHQFYVRLAEVKMKEDNVQTMHITIDNDQPIIRTNTNTYPLLTQTTRSQELEQINKELNQIVGITEVKNYILSLQAHMAMQKKREAQGMKTASISKHMIFTGNPGTGKTTIARLFARYMKAINALSQGQLVEVTRAELVAQYVGQTAQLTMSVVKSALGGVLFIDEAYSLYRGKDDSFGLEAIDTLVKAMEDHRDDLIVILAGYEKEMKTFLEANSGLRSRFPNIIHFPDYTGEELYEIAVIQAKEKGYAFADDVKDVMIPYFTAIQTLQAKEAGNGRMARNIVEDAILKQSKRVLKDPDANLEVLTLEDFNIQKQK